VNTWYRREIRKIDVRLTGGFEGRGKERVKLQNGAGNEGHVREAVDRLLCR